MLPFDSTYSARPAGASRVRAQRNLDRLLDLYDETHPAGGDETAKSKDAKAEEAFLIADDLLTGLVGWAAAHVLGKIAADPDLGRRERSEQFDDHQFEQLGAQPNEFSAEIKRNAIVYVLQFTASWWLVSELRHSLNALNAGEVQKLLAPSKSGRHRRAYTLALLRMQAVEKVYRLWGMGLKKHVAEERVSDALGVSIEALRKWEKSWLPELLGRSEVSWRKDWAKDFGQRAAKISSISYAVDIEIEESEKLASKYHAALRIAD